MRAPTISYSEPRGEILELREGLEVPLDVLAERLPEFRKEAEQAGRDPESLEVTVMGCPPEPEEVARFRASDVTRIVFGLPPAGRDVVLPLLDRYAGLAEEIG